VSLLKPEARIPARRDVSDSFHNHGIGVLKQIQRVACIIAAAKVEASIDPRAPSWHLPSGRTVFYPTFVDSFRAFSAIE
jgi:hypothetical protein